MNMRRPLSLSLSLALSLSLSMTLAGEARAQPTSEPAKQVRADIWRDFSGGAFEQVIQKVDSVLKKPIDASEAAQLLLIKAQALLALGHADKARAAFVAAVQKDASAELDPARASPEAVRLMDRVRLELPTTLVVHVKAGDADVMVDDKDLGPAPLQTQVPPGARVVVARSADGRTARLDVQAPPGRRLVVELELSAAAREPRGPVSPVEPQDKTKVAAAPQVAKPDATKPETVRPEAVSTPAATTSASSGAQFKPLTLGLWIGGGAVIVAGALCLWQAGVKYDQLTNSSLPSLQPGEGPQVKAAGETLQALGWVGLGVGAAAAVTGGVLWWLDRRADAPHLGVVVTPGGAWVGVSGALPL
jgi:hypothetical protein